MWIPSYRSQRKSGGQGASGSLAILFLRGRGRGTSGVGMHDRGCEEVKRVSLPGITGGAGMNCGDRRGETADGVTRAVSGLGFRVPVLEPVTDSARF